MSIVFIDGIPGSGKSSMAANIRAEAIARGVEAAWYLEEAHDHPIHPVRERKSATLLEWIGKSLDNMRRFAAAAEHRGGLHILEGTAFQSTVRFLMQEEYTDVASYFAEFEKAARPSPSLIYLRPRSAASHSRWISAHRGDQWTEKVAGYLARTPYSRIREWSGIEGMHAFWSAYANACDGLVATSGMPTLTIEIVPGEWNRHLATALQFLETAGHLPARLQPQTAY